MNHTIMAAHKPATENSLHIGHPNSNLIESPSAWMQYGTSPTEIILATAVVIGSVGSVIGAIALLLNVILSTMPSSK